MSAITIKSRRQWQRRRRRKTTRDVVIVLSMRKWSSNLQIRWLTNHTQFCSKAWKWYGYHNRRIQTRNSGVHTIHIVYDSRHQYMNRTLTYLNIVSTQSMQYSGNVFLWMCAPSCVVCDITSCIIYKNFNAGIFKHCHTQIYKDS